MRAWIGTCVRDARAAAAIASLVALIVGLPAIAQQEARAGAKDLSQRQIGAWHVSADPMFNERCSVERDYPEGSYLRLEHTGRTVVVLIGNPRWRGVTENGQYPIALHFDGAQSWPAEAIGVAGNESSATLLAFRAPTTLIDMFSAHRRFRLRLRNRNVVKLPLEGAKEALQLLKNCSEASARR